MALLKYQCFYLIKDKMDLLFRTYFEFAYMLIYISYCFSYLVSAQMQNAITEAVQIYNDLTCVRFIPRNQASGLPHASYLYLTRGYGQSKSVVLSSIFFQYNQIIIVLPSTLRLKMRIEMTFKFYTSV